MIPRYCLDDCYKDAIELAEYSLTDEGDDKTHPKVGAAVYVPNEKSARFRRVVGSARAAFHFGEHAEHGVLERCLVNANLRDGKHVLFSTLEPCTKRNPPKKACTDRIIARGVREVHIGLLDPNPKIYGGGAWKMVRNGINVEYFPPSFRERIYESNETFIKEQEKSFDFNTFRRELPQAYVHPQEPFLGLVYGLFRKYEGKAVVLFNTRLKTFLDPHEFQASIAQGLFYNRKIENVYVVVKEPERKTLEQEIGKPGMLQNELRYWCNAQNKRGNQNMRVRFRTLEGLEGEPEAVRCVLFLNEECAESGPSHAEFGVFNTVPEAFESLIPGDSDPPRVLLGVASEHTSPFLKKHEDHYAPLLAKAEDEVHRVVGMLGGWHGNGWVDLKQLLTQAQAATVAKP